ncbi:Transcriptional regulator, HxlR family [Acidisarcina polymorpha]|uniref:Transcriptional regulator, HxlR family n=1 Tax=Acidisarcina polymorpha TaxID=2211140 RepID=A0A2Z5G7U3_9BACT|nr:helix-turn-helix domain-containing protein [Acidisarcina polymorpha]AXC15058.1 Transcriptional regulator, HxlR family [Acidisarcina polymorpha]
MAKEHYGCPVQATINLLSGKWKVQILWHLSFQPLRFAELRRKLPKITEKVLTEQVRLLEAGGLVQRDVTPSVPPAVTYSLKPEGERLIPMLANLCDWGSQHFHMLPSLPRPKQPVVDHAETLIAAS